MSTDGMPDVAALLFGTAIIIVFSYERFNRISYETSRRLQRLVTFLTPDKLRARQQVTYAYSIYTLSLVVLYLTLCAYAEVLLPLLGAQALLPDVGASALPDAGQAAAAVAAAPQTPFVSTGFSPLSKPPAEFWTEGLKPTEIVVTKEDISGINIAPEVSLGLALVFVGLAPSIKALVRVDEWLRMFAHRVAGIPTWVIEASDALRANAKALRFSPENPDGQKRITEDYLISASDIEKVKDLRERAQPHLGNLEDFCLNVEVIMVASAWFLDEKLRVPGTGDKLRFEEVENELKRRKTELLRAADIKKLSREEWELLAADADDLAADFCVLIALYDEQDIIQPFSNRSASTESQRRARDRLKNFINVLYKNKTEPMMQRRGSNLALFWTLAIVMTWALCWSALWPGAAEFNLTRTIDESGAYERMLVYSVTAFNTYCVAVIVAITLRWMRMMTIGEDGLRKWENMRYPTHWTRWLPQAAAIVLVAWAISSALVVAVQMWQSGYLGTPRAERSFEQLMISLRSRFEYNAPIAFRGAVLGLLVIILLDARQRLWQDSARFARMEFANNNHAERLRVNSDAWRSLSHQDSWKWVALGGSVMLVTTLVTRYLSFLATTRNGRAFDQIDTGLMIWAVIYSVTLTAIVMFCLSEVLTSRAFQRPSDEHAAPSGSAIKGADR